MAEEAAPPAKRSRPLDEADAPEGQLAAGRPAESAADAAADADDDGDAEILLGDDADDGADGAAGDGADGGGGSAPVLTERMVQEEAKLAEESAAADAAARAKQAAEHRGVSRATIAHKVQRLNDLLEKSIVYSVSGAEGGAGCGCG